MAAETAGGRWLEEALRGARDQIEEDVRAWIADLTAANTALGHELCSQKRFSGITASPVFVAEPQTNSVGERFNRTLKEQAIHGRLFLPPRGARQADAIQKDARWANLRPINSGGLQFEECGYRARREAGIPW